MNDIYCWETKFKPCYYSDRLLNKISCLNEKVTTKQRIDLLEIKKAIYYAKKYHSGQMRDSGEPYYTHPLEVAYILAEYAADEDQKYFVTDLLVTSVLHDTIEDTKLTFALIKNIFSEIIANQVMDLTRIKEDGSKISSAKMLKLLWSQKKYGLLIIKLIDRLHNMQTIQAKSTEKIQKTANETFESFIAFTMYTQFKNLETLIYQFCCKTLSIEIVPEMLQATEDASRLANLEDTDMYQLLSRVFQNIIIPTENSM